MSTPKPPTLGEVAIKISQVGVPIVGKFMPSFHFVDGKACKMSFLSLVTQFHQKTATKRHTDEMAIARLTSCKESCSQAS